MTEQQPSLPDNSDDWCWYQQGKKQNDEKQYEQAISCFDRAIEQESNVYEAWYGKGNALFALERYEEAIDCYEQSASINPDSYVAWESRGLALYKLKLYEDAISSLNRALEIKPDSYATFWARANAFYCLGRMEEAVEDYDKALEIKPDASEVWEVKGDTLVALQRHKQAIESYEKALAIQREAGDRRGELGTLLALSHLYITNSRIKDGALAQHQAGAIAKELNLAPDDPLYSMASTAAMLSTEQMSSIINRMGWMLDLMSFAQKSKLQTGLFVGVVWLLLATVSVVFLPITFAWGLLKKLVGRT